MASFYSLTLKASAFQIQIINTFWYRRAEAAVPNGDALSALRSAWLTRHMADWLGMHTAGYVMQEVITQGYSDSWERLPYLPEVFPNNQTGGDTTPAAPPIMAAILSCKVTPVVKGQRSLPSEPFRESYVRRGYWAVSPINEGMVDAGGQFAGFPNPPGVWATFANNMSADLPVAGWTTDAQPIVVSSPPKGVTQRGYGLISAATWAKEISTRRSRKMGRGA